MCNYYINSLYSSMVERNTVNILIDVRFILRAYTYMEVFLYFNAKGKSGLAQWLERCATDAMIQVRVLYALKRFFFFFP